jgi:hypothetical protein
MEQTEGMTAWTAGFLAYQILKAVSQHKYIYDGLTFTLI